MRTHPATTRLDAIELPDVNARLTRAQIEQTSGSPHSSPTYTSMKFPSGDHVYSRILIGG
jgi:hypothetical protein